jgi:hypothetical protein
MELRQKAETVIKTSVKPWSQLQQNLKLATWWNLISIFTNAVRKNVMSLQVAANRKP